MTSWVVADSSIMLTAFLPEPITQQAKRLLRTWETQNIQIAAPVLFRYEIVAVTRKTVHRGIMSAEEAAQARDFLLEYPVLLLMDDDLLRCGYDLATRFNRPTAYDAQYLAVAERLSCEFWTADKRLFNAVAGELGWVKRLGDFAS